MDITSADSPVEVVLRQVSFRPDADVRGFLDAYVTTQGYEIKGFIQRLIRDEMKRVSESAPAPKVSGRKDVARNRSGGPARELVSIEEMAIA
jgi:hypothetical protein